MVKWLLTFSLLCLGAATGLAAQGSARPAQVRAPVATSAGPRIEQAWPRYDAALSSVADTRANVAAADLNDNHTLVISTLGLILLAVVAVLLLAK